MQQSPDRSETRTCAKARLLGLTRTGGLLMGAALAGMLLVDPPIPAGRTDAPSAPPYVPASDTWIEPGAISREAALIKELKTSAAAPAHRADRPALQKPPQAARADRDRTPVNGAAG